MKLYCVTCIDHANVARDAWHTNKRDAMKLYRDGKARLLSLGESKGLRVSGSVSLRLVIPKKLKQIDRLLSLLRGDREWVEKVEVIKNESVLASGQKKLFAPDGNVYPVVESCEEVSAQLEENADA